MLEKDFYIDTLNGFIKVWGEVNELRMCIEKMGEMTKTLCKYSRIVNSDISLHNQNLLDQTKNSIISATADVIIYTYQIARMFGMEKVRNVLNYKIIRCRKFLNKALNLTPVIPDNLDKNYFHETFELCFKAWGEDGQIRMCIEEMSELTKELCKFIRYSNEEKSEYTDGLIKQTIKNIIEETADVLICSGQMKLHFGNEQVIEKMDYSISIGKQIVEKHLNRTAAN